MILSLLDTQTWYLFAGIGAVLIVASLATAILTARLTDARHEALLTNLKQRVVAWWIMVAVILIALILGEIAVIALFLILSLLALREFITIAPTDQRDHHTLVWLFFIIPPLHYFAVLQHWYGFFAIFIPVYAYLFLPARNALAGETRDFMQRSAVIQWALMVCVYAVSYAPALLQLPVAIAEGKTAADGSAIGAGGPEGGRLLLFLFIVVQGSDVLQYIWGKSLGRHTIVPTVSPNKTWEGFIGGVLSATALGAGLWWATPFTVWQAGALAFISCLLGFAGGLVMSAIKRDRGIKDFGSLLPGHGGILDRIDSLIFAAPVFFHLTRFFFAS